VVDLAGDVALEAADDFALGQAFGGAALDVVAGGLVVPNADDRDDVERAVGCSVAAAAESVTTGGASAAGWLGCDAAEFGEGCLGVDSVCVVAGCDQELPGEFDTDAVEFDEFGCSCSDQGFDLLVEVLDLGIEALPAAGPGRGGRS